MENKRKISIIIANYNNGHFFKNAYESLIAQTFEDWEAIIIDDCSTDNSVEVIKNMIAEEPRCKFFQNENNIGYQKTILYGIELSVTNIFGRLDPDDTLYPEAIELSYNEHMAHPEVGLVYTDVSICNRNLELLYHHKSSQIESLDEKYYLLSGEIGAFATFKKDIYKKTGGIDTFIKRAEDIDIYMKMCEIAPVKRIPQPLYYYRILPTSLSKGDNGERSFFWHFVSLIKMSERRNINIEDLFVEHFIDAKEVEPYRNRRKELLSFIKNNKLLSLLWGKTGREL